MEVGLRPRIGWWAHRRSKRKKACRSIGHYRSLTWRRFGTVEGSASGPAQRGCTKTSLSRRGPLPSARSRSRARRSSGWQSKTIFGEEMVRQTASVDNGALDDPSSHGERGVILRTEPEVVALVLVILHRLMQDVVGCQSAQCQ
jgi:hypothetical protein